MERMAKNGWAGLVLATMLATSAPALAAPAAHNAPAQTQLLRRAQAGDVKAYDLLANSYLAANGDARDVEAAVHWLQAGVKAGDTDCMIDLGNLYYEGSDLEQDDGKALTLYVAAASHGAALGAYNAGLVYEASGEDLTQALNWYRQAAGGGDEGGMYKVAKAYQLGRGVTTDAGQAVAWMTKAAEAGSSDAMNDLGSYYSEGYGVAADQLKALKLFKGAAQAGSAVAMENVGVVYHDGEGVPVDFEQARAWYIQAANNGDMTAYFDLAQMYEDGEGVKASAAKAVQLYRAASESDDEDVAQAAADAIERLESGSSETPIA